MIFRAIVKTNCKEDPYFRVKVENKQLWQETSELLPSVNGIYLEVGDVVLVEQDSTECYIILGKLFDKTQTETETGKQGPVLFRAQNQDSWITASVDEEMLILETSKGNKITIDLENQTIEIPTDFSLKAGSVVTIEGDNVTVKGNDVTVKGSNITVDGKTTYKNPVGTPDGKGPLCGVPACIFSGSPHSASSTG